MRKLPRLLPLVAVVAVVAFAFILLLVKYPDMGFIKAR